MCLFLASNLIGSTNIGFGFCFKNATNFRSLPNKILLIDLHQKYKIHRTIKVATKSPTLACLVQFNALKLIVFNNAHFKSMNKLFFYIIDSKN
jgi:hypothetical protein